MKIIKTILTVLLSVICMSLIITGVSCSRKEPNEPPTGGTVIDTPGKVPVYRIEYVADGVTVGFDEYIHAGSELVPPEVPEKKGYTGKWEDYSIEGEGDIIVNAIYTPITYTITYNVVKNIDGVYEEYRGNWEYWTSTYSESFKYYTFPTEYNVESDGLKIPDMPEVDINPKYHEVFLSWYTDKECTEKIDSVIYAGTTGDLTLYAKSDGAWIGPY